MFANRRRHAEQVLRAGTAHEHQFGHERLRLVDMLQHFHAHHFARATIGQRQRQTVADQSEIQLAALRFDLTSEVAHLVQFTVGEDHRGALADRKQCRDTFAATDVEQRIVSRDCKALEQLTAVTQKPAVENGVT